MKYRIKSARLSCWDYTNEGWYYVTICTKDFVKWFGNVSEGKMTFNDFGHKCVESWNNIPAHYSTVFLDEYVVMPNHIHGIIVIDSSKQTCSIGNVVGGFKSEITKWARENGYLSFKWQTRFYEHIIRNREDLDRIRKYIYENPLKWNANEIDV